jgi:lipopolysaccharide/colanic/teichoic acid biosynthesis glycosyltransferase
MRGTEGDADAGTSTLQTNTLTADREPFESINRLSRSAGAALKLGGPADGTVEITPDAFGPIAIPEPARIPSARAAEDAVKRGFDLVLATLLLVVAAPLLLAIAVLIKLDSPGPVLYRSRRIGRNGTPFEMLKFRTMFEGADDLREALRPLNEASPGFFKLSSDPRMTRVGRVLRSTCLDELPQVLQVMTGKMSLVGPRPLVSEESALIPSTSARFRARPGITGPWQLAGSWQIPIPKMVEMDCAYLEQWSLLLDLKLLCRTAVYAARRGGV